MRERYPYAGYGLVIITAILAVLMMLSVLPMTPLVIGGLFVLLCLASL